MPQFNGSLRNISPAKIIHVHVEWNIYGSLFYTQISLKLFMLYDKEKFLFTFIPPHLW